tara:strand:+ start:6074 stop:7516 length:1443 start_codon:yes stop_codon:yes gene_type:complete
MKESYPRKERSMVTKVKNNDKLLAHLMRRASFGSTYSEIKEISKLSYDEIVDSLISPEDTSWMGAHIIRRHHFEHASMMSHRGLGEFWLYRMATTKSPLIEKMTLFWHGVFATGYPKVVHGMQKNYQIDMFRKMCLEDLDSILLELSKDPAMIIWLDNQENHNGAINENYGRELLELFSMGVGNYSEDDIKECARAFTGWTIANRDYMVERSERDSDQPFGRIAWHFKFDEKDHDFGEKTFLGETGNFNGEDIVKIICKQESTARFIARRLYNFFVEDEVPVPSWNDVAPKNPEAIDILVKAYFDNNHSIKEMVRTLFNSDFFKSDNVRYKRVKSPVELVTGVLRMTGDLDRPKRSMFNHFGKMEYMGQWLTNPPTVEGWHDGTEWIETGSIVERVNYASEQLSNNKLPGVKTLISNIMDSSKNREDIPEICLRELGVLDVSTETMSVLMEFTKNPDISDIEIVTGVIKLIASSPDFQNC